MELYRLVLDVRVDVDMLLLALDKENLTPKECLAISETVAKEIRAQINDLSYTRNVKVKFLGFEGS